MGFELHEEPIQGATFTIAMIRCAGCGAPIGVLEDENLSALIREQEISIAELNDRISNVEKMLAPIAKGVTAILRRLPRGG
jgi:hypothetical protein